MMRDQVLCPFDDPSEIANTKLAPLKQRHCNSQAGRIRKRLEAGSDPSCRSLIKTCAPEILRERQVKAEQVAVITSHRDNLTPIDMWPTQPTSDPPLYRKGLNPRRACGMERIASFNLGWASIPVAAFGWARSTRLHLLYWQHNGAVFLGWKARAQRAFHPYMTRKDF